MRYLTTATLPAEVLRVYPGNARRSDLKTIAESLARNNQYRSVVVQVDDPEHPEQGGVILAGNHTFLAATQELGHAEVRCELIDCDDTEARRINLVDNRLSDQADYDEDALVELLRAAAEAAVDGLAGTGYTEADLAKLTTDSLPEPGDAGEDELASLFGVIVECDTETQQAQLLEQLSAEGWPVRALMR